MVEKESSNKHSASALVLATTVPLLDYSFVTIPIYGCVIVIMHAYSRDSDNIIHRTD
jgi:hypothetical protein